MSVEALLERVATAIEANTAAVEKLTAGREAALAQLEKTVGAGEPAKPARGRGKKADETAAVTTETPAATTETPAETPAPAASGPTVTEEELRKAAVDYVGSVGQEKAGPNLKAIADHFGVSALAGPTGIQDGEQRAQAAYYIARYGAGLEVNFSEDYDFASDPTAEAAPAADEFNIG